MIKELPGWSVVNAGVSGDTTAGGLQRLGWILKSKPDAVFVALGGNDGLRGLKPSETEKNLDAILAKIKAAGAKPLLAGMMVPTNYGQDYFFDVKVLYPRVAKRGRERRFSPSLLEGVGGKPDLNQADGLRIRLWRARRSSPPTLVVSLGSICPKPLPPAPGNPRKPSAPSGTFK